MADVAENLRTFLLADSGISTTLGAERIGQNRAQQDWGYPYVVFYRSGTDSERCIGDAVGLAPFRHFFDVECVSSDIDGAADLAEAIKTYADNFTGTFGTQSVQLIAIEDHDDEYQPRTPLSDEAVHIAAINVELMGVA